MNGNKVRWTPKRCDQINELYPTMSNKEISIVMQIPVGCIKNFAANHGLRKDPSYNRMESRKLSADKVEFIRQNYDKFTNHDLASMVECHESTVHKIRRELSLPRRKNFGCFKKGHRPANFRKKRPGFSPGNMSKTQFKKGHSPKNTLHDGAITIRAISLFSEMVTR